MGTCPPKKEVIPNVSYNEDMMRSARLLVIFLLCVITSCTVAPSGDDIKKAITDYFDKQDYRVVYLKVGKIEDIHLAEKTYMGTPSYVVEITSIVLEAQSDKGSDIMKGNRLTFSGAKISMRQDIENKRVWRVSI